MKEPILCFACGGEMQAVGKYSGWCGGCEVLEFRDPEPYVNRTRTVKSQNWGGVIRYLDHSAGHYPSPGLRSRQNMQVRYLAASCQPEFSREVGNWRQACDSVQPSRAERVIRSALRPREKDPKE